MVKLVWGRGYILIYACSILLNSPFLFMFGNDHVTCHTGAYVIPSEDGDA